ncbi:MAG: YlxR family protein [Eubacterium sp.]|nr:YlxR family protein [Eubacterium sp.]
MKTGKKKVERICIGCGETREKADLIRLVKNKEGEIFLDPTGKMNGRGAYICREKSCFEKMKKSRGLNRTFKINVPMETYEELERQFYDQY